MHAYFYIAGETFSLWLHWKKLEPGGHTVAAGWAPRAADGVGRPSWAQGSLNLKTDGLDVSETASQRGSSSCWLWILKIVLYFRNLSEWCSLPEVCASSRTCILRDLPGSGCRSLSAPPGRRKDRGLQPQQKCLPLNSLQTHRLPRFQRGREWTPARPHRAQCEFCLCHVSPAFRFGWMLLSTSGL